MLQTEHGLQAASTSLGMMFIEAALTPRSSSDDMPRLAFGQRAVAVADGRPVFGGKKFFQKIRRIAAAGALAVLPESFRNELRVERKFAREKFKQQFHQPRQRDAVRAVDFGVKPVAEAQKGVEWQT